MFNLNKFLWTLNLNCATCYEKLPQVFAIKFKNVNLNGVLNAEIRVIKGFLVKICSPLKLSWTLYLKFSNLLSGFGISHKSSQSFPIIFCKLFNANYGKSIFYLCLFTSSTLQSTRICKLIDGQPISVFKVKVLKASVNTRLFHIYLVFHTLSLHTHTLWQLTVLISNYSMLLTRTSHNIYLFVRKWTVKKVYWTS